MNRHIEFHNNHPFIGNANKERIVKVIPSKNLIIISILISLNMIISCGEDNKDPTACEAVGIELCKKNI